MTGVNSGAQTAILDRFHRPACGLVLQSQEISSVCGMLADRHTDNLLSPVVCHEDGGSMPALIWRKFLGNNERMRRGAVGSRKDGPGFVRISLAVLNVEIKPAALNEALRSGFSSRIGSRGGEALDMALGLRRNRGIV
jgi:hypothetical protein